MKGERVLTGAAALLFFGCLGMAGWFESRSVEMQSDVVVMEEFLSVDGENGIRELRFEDYVCGVAARSISGECPMEVLKAQMVITRTNLLKFQKEHVGTLLSEEYLSPEEMETKGIWAQMQQAAQQTKGQVLTFEGELVQIPFHAVSSGTTRSGIQLGEDYRWLTGVSSSYDLESSHYLSVYLEDEEKIRQICNEESVHLQEEDLLGQIEILERDEGGYVLAMQVGDRRMGGEMFRSMLSLPSSCFTLEEIEGKIRITIKGLGHGLGLSQYGACRMAENGSSYQDILNHYFIHLTLETWEL